MNMIALWRLTKPLLPLICGVVLILGAIVWIDHRGYERAERDAERRWQEQIAIAAAETKRIEGKIEGAVSEISKDTGEQLAKIRVNRQTIVQNITQEMSRDPRYYSDEFTLSDRVRHYINSARAGGSSARAAASFEVDLPRPTPAE